MSRYYTVFILCLTVFFLFADQNLMAPNLSAMAKDFGFNDQERDEKLGGYVALGFFVVGGPVALFVGYLADTTNRCILFAAVVTFGEVACFATYFVETYMQLLICRVLTGISIGGSTPIIFSLLGDLFPESSRVYVSTLVGIAMSTGIAGGQLLAGVIGPSYGWRLPFLLVSIPAIICGNIAMLTVKDPPRGSQEQAVRVFRQQSGPLDSKEACTKPLPRDWNGSHTENIVPGQDSLQTFCGGTTDRATGDRAERALGDGHHNPLLQHQQHCWSDDVAPSSLALSGTNAAAVGESELELLDAAETMEGGEDEVEDLAAAAGHYSERIEWRKVSALLRTPSVALILLQGLPGCLPWGMVYVFLNDYLSSDRGLSVRTATLALTLFGIGGLVGQLWGGWYGQRLYNRDPCYQCILMGATTILSVFPMLYLLNARAGGALFFIMALVSGMLVSINGPNVRTVLQNVCIPEVRGSAFAVFMLTDDLGKGLGPALVVLFIAAFNGDRRNAFTVVVLSWLLSGFLLLALVFFVHADEAAVQANVAQSLLRRSNANADLMLQSSEQCAHYRPFETPTSSPLHHGLPLQEESFNSYYHCRDMRACSAFTSDSQPTAQSVLG